MRQINFSHFLFFFNLNSKVSTNQAERAVDEGVTQLVCCGRPSLGQVVCPVVRGRVGDAVRASGGDIIGFMRIY